jgi:NADH-quinone oxidoreductase subunit A
MLDAFLPVLLMIAIAAAVSAAMVAAGRMLGPRRSTPVKQMPYESGMDPIHDARRRFGVHFYLVAITFLVFDVELLFLYPWAVARTNPDGLAAAVAQVEQAGGATSAAADPATTQFAVVFAGVMVFLALVVAGFAYDWRKGVFRWR